MRIIKTIKLSGELAELLERTSAKCRIDKSEVLKATARGIASGRPVIQLETSKRITSAGKRMENVRGLAIPDGVSMDEFRRVLALRCLEELSRPERRQTPPPSAIEGLDYNVSELTAARALGVL